MKPSTLVRLLFAFSAILLAWPLAGLPMANTQAARNAQRDTSASQPPSVAGDQKAGSILIYNYYKSDRSQKDTDTEISLTNTHPDQPVTAHLFFVRQTNCSVTDTYVCVTSGQTVTLRASDYDPKGEGYVIAVAVDRATGLPLSHNFMTGSEYIRSASEHGGRVNALAVNALFEGVLKYDQNSTNNDLDAVSINFDGRAYGQLPRALTLDKVASPADGNDTRLVVNRIGGNLASRGATVGALSGSVYSDAGRRFSFTTKADSCQLETSLADILPTASTAIPAGATAKIELADASRDIAGGGLVGMALNANNRSESFASARNFEPLVLSSQVSLLIPVGVPPQACRTLEAVGGADLEMGKTADPALSVVRGNNITYTLTSKNKGFDSAFNVVIRDSLPGNTTFVSAIPSPGGSCTVPQVGSAGTVTCTWGGTTGLLVTRSVVIVVRVDDTLVSGSEVVNTGETYSSVSDPNQSNNTRTVRTVVTAQSNELVIATQSLPVAKIGLQYTATLVAVNATAPVVWSAVGAALPEGLLLNPNTGVISGTPTRTGYFPTAFRITDGDFRIAQKSLPLQVVSQFRAVKSDFDADGKTDLAYWRGPSGNWSALRSSNGTLKEVVWGLSTSPYFDVPTPGDYDGDGKTDIAVWRKLDGYWFIINSSDDSIRVEQLGVAGDTPVPGDYDGDGRTDLAVWRGSETNWYIKQSSNGTTQIVSWGSSLTPYFDVPVPADYDGDGKTDIAVWRGNTGVWFIKRSSNGATQQVIWGLSTAPYFDVPVPGDYDGDGSFDVGVWRGNVSKWYITRSSNGTLLDVNWGSSLAPYFDIPVASDYDGDGKTDIAVWRSSTGVWFVRRSTDEQAFIQAHGQTGDTPIPR